MNLAELYSLSSGQKLDKIYTFEKFFPGLPDNYIVIQPWSKPSKNYDAWEEVLSIILPYLQKEGIKIIQVGAKDEKPLNFCQHLMGQTNWGQLEYVISKAKLVLTSDSISSHLAGHYNLPLVCLISNNLKECVSPYFGDKSKQIILEPNRTNKNPSFMLDEGPNKQINEIFPEEIAKSVLKLLNIEFNYPYKTILLGKQFQNRIIESDCTAPVNVQQMGLQNILMRLDYSYNLNVLVQQASLGKISIVTDKIIPTDLLSQIRPQIVEILYEIKSDSDPNFCKTLQELKIPYRLYSKLNDEQLNPLKLNYLDYPIIGRVNTTMPPELKDKKIENLFIKGSKFIISSRGLFPSYWSYKCNKPIPDFNAPPQQLIDINVEYLFQDIDYLMFLEKSV